MDDWPPWSDRSQRPQYLQDHTDTTPEVMTVFGNETVNVLSRHVSLAWIYREVIRLTTEPSRLLRPCACVILGTLYSVS